MNFFNQIFKWNMVFRFFLWSSPSPVADFNNLNYFNKLKWKVNKNILYVKITP